MEAEKGELSSAKNVDLVFLHVSLEKYIGLMAGIFRTNKNPQTPEEFATALIEDRNVNGRAPAAKFAAIPTPTGEWGWMYVTASGRQLFWLPGQRLICRGMSSSKSFRARLERILGEAYEVSVREAPLWLDNAIVRATYVNRPSCVYNYATAEEKLVGVDNQAFFSIAAPVFFR